MDTTCKHKHEAKIKPQRASLRDKHSLRRSDTSIGDLSTICLQVQSKDLPSLLLPPEMEGRAALPPLGDEDLLLFLLCTLEVEKGATRDALIERSKV